MSSVKTRLSGLLGHLASPEAKDHPAPQHRINYHTLSPTFFLPRAAAIEPDVRLFFSLCAAFVQSNCFGFSELTRENHWLIG
jgi:hypothetical protein